MAQQNIRVDAGTGSPVDFFETTGTNYRQIVGIGDNQTDANYASVDAGGNLNVRIRPTFVINTQGTFAIQSGGSVSIAVGSVPLGVFIASNGTPLATSGSISITGGTISFTNATLQFTNSTITASGDVASGAADAGNPVKIGFVARTALPTAVSNGQRVNSYGDKFGRAVVVPYATRDIVGTNYTIISNTAETFIVPQQGSGVFSDITALWITNTGNTQTVATIRSTTGGATVVAFNVPAQDMRGAIFSTPLAHPTANGTWTIQTNNSVIVTVSVQFIKNQ